MSAAKSGRHVKWSTALRASLTFPTLIRLHARTPHATTTLMYTPAAWWEIRVNIFTALRTMTGCQTLKMYTVQTQTVRTQITSHAVLSWHRAPITFAQQVTLQSDQRGRRFTAVASFAARPTETGVVKVLPHVRTTRAPKDRHGWRTTKPRNVTLGNALVTTVHNAASRRPAARMISAAVVRPVRLVALPVRIVAAEEQMAAG